MINLKHNVVERLYVVHAQKGGSEYQFRVKAESETTAKAKAERDIRLRFNDDSNFRITSVERIDPEDYI